MKADLAKREPGMLERWNELSIYERIQEARADAPLYVLHDGPPYSNGHIHYGHILNKVLKDIVVKYKTMAGFRAPYVPGWDTHGLPIELAVDRELGDKKASMSETEVRHACRDYALKYVEIQREEFKRLGGFGAWEKPYLTLNPTYEAAITRALAAFARGGFLYRGKKPVHWCPSCQTALAEAEIEYQDHSSPSIYVRFPLAAEFDPARLDRRLAGKRLAVTIWTTTPWTLPANLAVVLHPRFEYVAVPNPQDAGECLIVAKELAPAFLKAIGAASVDDDGTWVHLDNATLGALEGVRYRHPFIEAPRGEHDFKIWFAEYVTLEQGTGLVHTAPGHGAEDYVTGMNHGLEPYAPIDNAGRYTDEVPEWQGRLATDANPDIVARLHADKALLNQPGESIRHSYAHCWRCKGPILFRATAQWFMRIDHNSFRERGLSEIDLTTWVPPWGRNRIYAMIENRPDWVLSRQRLWGVPIPALHCTACGEDTVDGDVIDHVAQIFEAKGADAWYELPLAELVPPGTSCGACGAGIEALEREKNIVDVWFESGCSWFAMARTDKDFADIDLYLEGSDQHRGWFHSSLLVGIGVKGAAPYKTVLTHGFVLDENGHPYSKSAIERARAAGQKIRFIPPEEVITKYGAEILRMWVGSTDFRNDIPYSETLLTGLTDWYRKFRNTARFLLGNVADFVPDEHPLESLTLTDLDRYMLARLGHVIAKIREAYDNFEFHVVHRLLVDFVTVDLSAQYMDVVKDRLYSDAKNSSSRRAAQSVLYNALRAVTTLSAPIMSFTAEDIWTHIPKRANDPESVHLARVPAGKLAAEDDPLFGAWARLLEYRDLCNKAMETFRAQKHKSIDAVLTIKPTAADRAILAPRLDELADLFIVSKVTLTPENAAAEPEIDVAEHAGARCARCWKWFDSLAIANPELCNRCSDAVTALHQEAP